MTSLKELGQLIDGKVVGDPKLSISGVSALAAGKKGTISYLYNTKFKKFLDTTKASAVIVSDESLINNKSGLVVDDPRLAFVKILEFYSDDIDSFTGIHKSALISK